MLLHNDGLMLQGSESSGRHRIVKTVEVANDNLCNWSNFYLT